MFVGILPQVQSQERIKCSQNCHSFPRFPAAARIVLVAARLHQLHSGRLSPPPPCTVGNVPPELLPLSPTCIIAYTNVPQISDTNIYEPRGLWHIAPPVDLSRVHAIPMASMLRLASRTITATPTRRTPAPNRRAPTRRTVTRRSSTHYARTCRCPAPI